jgi:hypothetical protein
VGDHLNLTIRTGWTFLALCCADHSKSLRNLAQENDIELATAHKAVREKFNIFPYTVTAVQELKPANHEKRIRYLNGLKILFKRKLLKFMMSHSLQMRPGSISGFVNAQNT